MINTEHSSTQAHNPTAATKTIQMAQGGPSSAMVNWTHPTFRFYSAPSPGCLETDNQKQMARQKGKVQRSKAIVPTSKKSSDCELSGLAGCFLEHLMLATLLQRYHQHHISSCIHPSLHWKPKTPLFGLNVQSASFRGAL